jgi:hypothetical protein
MGTGRIADRGDRRLATPNARQPHGRHQALHGAPGDSHAIAQQLVPDFARSIEPGTGLVDALDLRLDLVITTGTRGAPAGSARRRACSW